MRAYIVHTYSFTSESAELSRARLHVKGTWSERQSSDQRILRACPLVRSITESSRREKRGDDLWMVTRVACRSYLP